MMYAVLSTIKPDRSQAHAPARAGAGGMGLLPLSPCPELGTWSGYHRRIHDSLIRDSASTNPFLSPGVFSDIGLRTASGLVARVSGKVDVPGRTEAAGGPHIAYCRVSSRDQNPQLQLDALHTHGYDQLFAEKQSASTARRGRSSPGPGPLDHGYFACAQGAPHRTLFMIAAEFPSSSAESTAQVLATRAPVQALDGRRGRN
jgi:hypothetical protein